MGCCGGSGAKAPSGIPARAAPAAASLDPSAAFAEGSTGKPGRKRVVYKGNRGGAFFVTGRFTGTKYRVPGRNKALVTMDNAEGVFVEDVAFIRSLGRGHEFVVEST
jgi:hypothetical protein